MDQRAWTECHVAAFGFFGGVPARLVPDNLRTGVDRPDLYDPKINRSYAELAAHYGFLVDPARARKPKDKAAVERPMPYVRDSFWRGREFTSLAQMQAGAVLVGGRRRAAQMPAAGRRRPGRGVRRRRGGRAGAAAALPFVLATWSRAKVGPDIHARAGAVLGAVAPDRPARRRAVHRARWCRSSPAASWSRPTSRGMGQAHRLR